MKRYSIARMKYRGSAGHYENGIKRNPNTGKLDKVYKRDFGFWYGLYRLTLTEELTLAGAIDTDVQVIAVRNDLGRHTIDAHTILELEDGNLWQIVKITGDDSINGTNLLTVKRYTENTHK